MNMIDSKTKKYFMVLNQNPGQTIHTIQNWNDTFVINESLGEGVLKIYKRSDFKKEIGQLMIAKNWIYFFVIDPRFRKKGIGTLLLEEAEKIIFQNGYVTSQLIPHQESGDLINWYLNRGYTWINDTTMAKNLMAEELS